VTPEEWDRLRASCRKCEDPRLYPLVVCAHESGARQGELLGMEWRRLELKPVVLDPETGERRQGVPRCEVVDTKNGIVFYFPGEAGKLLSAGLLCLVAGVVSLAADLIGASHHDRLAVSRAHGSSRSARSMTTRWV
jgi:hypothetical protein